MPGETYDVGVRIGSTSDDAALAQFNSHLNKVLKDSARLSESLKGLSDSFRKEDDAAKTAGDSTEKAGKKAVEAKGGFDQLKDTLIGLGKMLLGLFALDKVITYFRESVAGAIEEERAVNNLAAAMRQMADATDEAIAANADFIANISKAAGIADDDLRPGMIQLLSATHDVTQAQDLLTIAAGAAARGQGTLSENVSQITRALETGNVRGVGPFTNALRAAMDQGKITEGGARDLAAAYGDAGANVHNAGIEVARSTVAWNETKDAIGGALQSVLIPLLPVLTNLARFIGMVTAGTIQLGGAFARTGIMAVEGFAWALSLLPGVAGEFWERTATKLRDVQENILIKSDDMAQAVMDGVMDATSKAEAAMKGTKTLAGGLGGLGAGKESKGDSGKDDSAAKSARELARAILDVRDAEVAEARADLESAQSTKDREAAIGRLVSALGRQSAAERDILEMEKAQALGGAKTAADRANIEETYRLKGIALDKKYAKEEMKVRADLAKEEVALEKWITEQLRKYGLEQVKVREDALKREAANNKKYHDMMVKQDRRASLDEKKLLRSSLIEELFLEQTSAKRRIEIARQLGKLDVDIAKMTAQQKRETYMQSAADLFALASQAFGKNKALMIGEALANTYLSATKAYAAMAGLFPAPVWGVIAAALAVVAGIKNVEQIKKAKPEGDGGSGFDNPEHDAMAGWAGRKWAEDWVNLTSAGFSSRLSTLVGSGAGARQTLQNITNRTTNGPRVNINANLTALSGSHGKRVVEDLARKIDRASPAVDRLRLSQPRVKRGSARRVNQ